MVTPADMTDRNAAKEALFRLRLMHPEITIVWADLAYAGALVDWAKSFLHPTIKTVSRPKGAKGFVVRGAGWWRGACRGCCTRAGTSGTTRRGSSTLKRCSRSPRSRS